MGGFFNPFRAPGSRNSRPRRCPRYAIESLEPRLSPSGFGLSAIDVGSLSTGLSASAAWGTLDLDFSDSGDGGLVLGSNGMGLNSDSLSFDTEPPPPDGDGTPPYTPPNTGGGPSGPA